jgi:antitoxin MazE
MTTTIRDIGNSKGIILPKNILAQCAIENEISIEVKNNRIVIAAVPVNKKKRKGWDKAFKEMARKGDDALAIKDVFDDENMKDWTWK